MVKTEDNPADNQNNSKNVKQDQIHDLLFNRDIGWQEIIYDLINTEQLDPWDINIMVLTDRFMQKIQNLEETDFFVSSKVLLAAALLLRIKSEILLNKYIKNIDDILFGSEEKKKYTLERIELDEEIPELVPKSPIPRYKRVTLQDLMESLNRAITTENRRINKEIIKKNALREIGIAIPKRKFSIRNKIREIYARLFAHFDKNKHEIKISFDEFIGKNREERILVFSPLLHLETQKKIWLEQENHFQDIHIWLSETYYKHNPDPFKDLKHDIEEEIDKEINEIEQLDNEPLEKVPKRKLNKKESKKRLKDIDEKFHNPIGD